MDPRATIDIARTAGASATTLGVERLRSQMQAQVRRSMGISEAPPLACDDSATAYFPPDSITRQVNGDLPGMLIGGIAALLFQMLHPLAMAGVAEHSNYRKDPLLVAWVHVCEVSSFLTAAQTYGPRKLSPGEQDQYIDQMARVGLGLGAIQVPRGVSDVHDYFQEIRPDLRLTREARTARNFCSGASAAGPTRSRPMARWWRLPRVYSRPGRAADCI